ncbi:MAG: signal peptidase II [Clostridia bacterium]|nr:signal peptidase II [Clostridia bacterium]
MIFLIAAVLVALDQLTKALAVVFLKGQPSFILWEGVFQLTFVTNKGAAFSILQNQRWVFIVVSLLAMGLLIWMLARKMFCGKLLLTSLCLILAGGVGNLIDRIALGYVVDFFDFCLINFAIFNVADVFITCGAVGLCLAVLLNKGGVVRERLPKRFQK